MDCFIYGICLPRNFSRYDTMKLWVILLSIFLSIPELSYSLNASKFLDALETNNIEHILSKLDVNSNTSSKEILDFFHAIKEICEKRYDISISLFQIQQDILDVCRENISNIDYLFKVEIFLNELFNTENINLHSQSIFLMSEKNYFEGKDIPVSILLGCVEIGCGALLWITPFRPIGTFLVCDGCRRMFNEVESIEKARNPNHNMFQKLLTSGTILYKL